MAPDGVSSPVVIFIGNPETGEIEYMPPGVPVIVTATGGLGVDIVLATLHRIAGI